MGISAQKSLFLSGAHTSQNLLENIKTEKRVTKKEPLKCFTTTHECMCSQPRAFHKRFAFTQLAREKQSDGNLKKRKTVGYFLNRPRNQGVEPKAKSVLCK